MVIELSPLWISLKTVLCATLIAFVLGILMAGWMLNYQGKAKGWLDALFTLPLVLPPTVVGFFLLLVFGKNSFVGQSLARLGLHVVFSWTATVIAATVVALPLMYRTTLGAFRQIDQNLLFAARTLGASELTVFWQITVPLAWQGILAGTILAFARALGEFGATLMLAGNIPGKTRTIPIAIFSAAEAGQMEQALAWVLMIVAISLIMIVCLNYLPQGESSRFGGRFKGLPLRFQRHFSTRVLQVLAQTPVRTAGKDMQTHKAASLQMAVKSYKPGFALDLTFVVGHEPLGILGASGSGKSMTLRCLAGLETPTSGQIILNERVLFNSEQGINVPSRQRRIGFLFQNYALFPHMTVAENIAFGLKYGQSHRYSLSSQELKQKVTEKMTLVHLDGLADRYPSQLSGGQQQRVAMARALAIEPDALLLDEPFSALDTYLRNQISQQLIEVLSNYHGVTLFVTHNLSEAYRVCQNLLVVSGGRAIACAPKNQIFERCSNLTVARLTECKNFSRAQVISPMQVKALDWGCTLTVMEPFPDAFAYVAMHAHHLSFTKAEAHSENNYPVWLVSTSETPHSMTLYLKLHASPTHPGDHQLQAEVSKEQWAQLKDSPMPWSLYFEPLNLLLLSA
ncbi:MAG: molybdate ABC transporter permease subunit [Cyanothece sp. SIO1E1]|nr:molybdate ABC transporter permease subunit [Cyanothece sp. SIO1E1]